MNDTSACLYSEINCVRRAKDVSYSSREVYAPGRKVARSIWRVHRAVFLWECGCESRQGWHFALSTTGLNRPRPQSLPQRADHGMSRPSR